MSCPAPDRKALEGLWRQRLEEAKQQLISAQRAVEDVLREFSDAPEQDSRYAIRHALYSENLALKQFNRVLGLYRALMVTGIIPDEATFRDTEL
jgi:hypothetical protein